jgi:hypothetical protein
MSAFSNEMEANIVSHFLQGTAVTASGGSGSAKVYLALFSGVGPGETGYPNEVSYTNYVRQHITFSPLDSNGNTSNTAIVTFPANPDSAAVVVAHAGVYSTDGGGTGIQLLHGALVASKTLDQNDVLSFGVGALVLNIN